MPTEGSLTFIALLCWGIWAVLSKLLGGALTGEQSQALSTLGLLPFFCRSPWRNARPCASPRARAVACVGRHRDVRQRRLLFRARTRRESGNRRLAHGAFIHSSRFTAA
jgi:hypothetical protein